MILGVYLTTINNAGSFPGKAKKTFSFWNLYPTSESTGSGVICLVRSLQLQRSGIYLHFVIYLQDVHRDNFIFIFLNFIQSLQKISGAYCPYKLSRLNVPLPCRKFLSKWTYNVYSPNGTSRPHSSTATLKHSNQLMVTSTTYQPAHGAEFIRS